MSDIEELVRFLLSMRKWICFLGRVSKLDWVSLQKAMIKMRPSIFFSANMSVKNEVVQLKPKLYLNGGSICTLTSIQGL